MLLFGSSFHGFTLQASDGDLGTFGDFLFDDASWAVRWMVVDTGSWHRRTALIHPSAIGTPDFERRVLPMRLTRAQIAASPDILLDEPVSRQIEYGLACFRDRDPAWGNPHYVAGVWSGLGVKVSQARLDEEAAMHKVPRGGGATDQGDPHLRSVVAVIGSHVHASDGPIGHVETLLIDGDGWTVRRLIVDLKDHWPGRRVLLRPDAVAGIDWPDHRIGLRIDRDAVKSARVWDPAEPLDRAYEKRLRDEDPT